MSLRPTDESYESPPSIHGREIRAQAQKACAIVHGRGHGFSANELWLLVLEHGLPPREERERILRAKLAQDDDVGDNTSS
jgi:hypothetical protein